VKLADHLAKIERNMQTLDHERRLVAREREQLGDATAKLTAREQDLKAREDSFRKRLDERIEERLREAKREIDGVVGALKTRTDSMAADAERRAARLIPTGETGAARAEARAALDAIADRLRSGRPAHPPAAVQTSSVPQRPVAVGDRVLVGPFGMEGVVKTLNERDAEVDIRGKRMRALVGDLRIVGGTASPARVQVNVELQPREGSLTELNVIGCNVDEALTRAGKFLDAALMSELKSVRVIHGYGTGQLRRAIAGFLHSHPLVANFSSAPAEQGGGGVTLVELKD
jgi:DNA mismatch repair protein MutS2